MNVRSIFSSPSFFLAVCGLALALAADQLAGQSSSSLSVLSRDGRRPLTITSVGGQDMVALDDLAAMFQLDVRDDGSSLTVSSRGRTAVLTPEQTIASVSGRLISLTAAPARIGDRWMVPLDFTTRALIPLLDTRLELRRASRLLIVGDLRVPRVTLRQEMSGGGTRVTVETAPPANSTVGQESNQRLLIKFDADALDLSLPAAVANGLVEGFQSLDATTIGIQLGPRFASIRTTTQVVEATSRLAIDILPTPPETAAPSISRADPAPPDMPPLGVTSSGFRTLVIDPGHGGEDTGVRGPTGTLEKDVTLALGRRLKASIEGRLGLRVLLTRDDDRVVAITDRTALANNNKADLFVSLHANGSFRPGVAGAAIFVASFDERMLQEAATGERLPAFGGGFRDIDLVPWNLAQIRHKERSAVLARLVADQYRDHVPLASRPTDNAPLRVLESANMPAILIEVGYLTNSNDEQQLGGEARRAALVNGIVDAIVRFRDGPTAGDAPR